MHAIRRRVRVEESSAEVRHDAPECLPDHFGGLGPNCMGDGEADLAGRSREQGRLFNADIDISAAFFHLIYSTVATMQGGPGKGGSNPLNKVLQREGTDQSLYRVSARCFLRWRRTF